MSIFSGVIADDFTGATDIANTLARQGMRVTQALGVPDKSFDNGDAQAMVIALKSRTSSSAEEAVTVLPRSRSCPLKVIRNPPNARAVFYVRLSLP